MQLTHSQIMDIAFSETVKGAIVANTDNNHELVFARKDINDKFYNLLASSPVLYSALTMLHERLTAMEFLLEAMVDQNPGANEDLTVKLFTKAIQNALKICVESQSFATIGLTEMAMRIEAERKISKTKKNT